MEEGGKKRLAAVAVAAVGVAYFLICPLSLPKELVLVPVWERGTAAAPHAPAAGLKTSGALFPFRFGDRYGYFSAEGEVLFAAQAGYGVALAREAYAAYDRLSESFSVRSPTGEELSRPSVPGYPFFSSGRRFVVGPGQDSVSELAKDGSVAWTYEFPSIVISFGSCPSLAAFGLLDGTIVGIDAKGREALRFSPGGSRIPGVYGVAVSPDGLLVAAVCGLDKQRLVVLEKRSLSYRVTYHRYLDSDFRRPVSIAFTVDGRRLAYETPNGVGIYDCARRAESLLGVPVSSALGLSVPGRDLLVVLAGGGGVKRLVCAAFPDQRVVDAPLTAKDAMIIVDGDSIFLGADGDLVRMDLREE